MDEILTEEIEFINIEHIKIRQYKEETSEKDGVLAQIATVVQNVLNHLGSISVTLYLLSSSVCMLREDASRSYLVSASLIGAGLCVLMTAICTAKFTVTGSNRLGYLVCLLMFFETRACEMNGDIYAMGHALRTAESVQRLREIQGAAIITCGVQLILGLLDLNFLVKFIRPISIGPTMILIGLFVTRTSTVRMANSSMFLFIITIGLMSCLHCIVYNCSNENQENIKIRNRLFVGVISVLVMWTLCAVLTFFELIFEKRSAARTDTYTGIYDNVSTFRFSFPFQWSVPEWKSESIYLLLPAAFIAVFEILADYHNNDKIRERSAVETNELLNTSMLIKLEAILGFLMNSMGVVMGLNVGVKKDGRRILDICVAVILIAISFSGSLCAFFTTVPEPIIAALIFMLFLSAVLEGFDMLKFIDLKSSRNIYILGISFLMAFFIPICIKEDLEITGKPVVDTILRCLLSTHFIIVGFTALLLDNLFRVLLEEPITYQESDEISNSSEGEKKVGSSQFFDCLSPFFA